MRQRIGIFLLALIISTPAPATVDKAVIRDFDRSVAAGLPAIIALPPTHPRDDGATGNGEEQLSVNEAIPASVYFGDAPPARMYRATLNGRPAVLTRGGRRLDITLADGEDVETRVFEMEDGAASHELPEPLAVQRGDPTRERVRRSAETPGEPQTVDIHMFVHNDVTGYMTREAVHAGYVAWWLSDALRILPFARVDVRYHPPIQGLSDMPYMHGHVLLDWMTVVEQWAGDEDLDDSHLRKYVLVTLAAPAPGVGGVAWQGGNAAVASIAGRYRILAHELGHMFGATHAAAEVQYRGGWWCESNMLATSSVFRSNCYRYSAENERRIRRYAIEVPDAAWNPHKGPPIED
ncbi:reprolysin-like metallopeptidase [Luteibacter sp.]|uniref:reprolysin-like metallopeptidase n=1 Tax=Luteibacter sp. TaxID=1886636 RepID=UPI003F806C54